jgi:hypothetical protein
MCGYDVCVSYDVCPGDPFGDVVAFHDQAQHGGCRQDESANPFEVAAVVDVVMLEFFDLCFDFHLHIVAQLMLFVNVLLILIYFSVLLFSTNSSNSSGNSVVPMSL